MTKRNNRWTQGKGHFSMTALPAVLQSAEGIAPHQLVMDPAIGSEMELLWLDRTPFIFDLAKVTPFDLRLKSGLVRTSQGPFFFLLFYVPDPKHPGASFAAMDAHVNIYDVEHMQMWRHLADQSHWHLVLVGKGDKVADLFEFQNTFGLDSTLDQVETACKNIPGGSFELAKAEFIAKYQIDDLLNL